MGICVFAEVRHRLEVSDVTYRLEDMDRVLEEGEDVGRVDVDAIFLLEILGDLAVVKAVFTEFQDLAGEFLLWAAAHGGVTAGAAQERVDEVEDLLVEGMVQPVKVEP